MSVFGELKETLLLEGLMPERALLRLRREGIAVYDAKKIEKNQILFRIKRKDSEKVFAIYPNVCYNNSVYSAYTVKKRGARGALKYLEWAKRRAGLLLGGLLCIAMVLISEPLVFAIEFKGTDIYAREAKIALEEAGITPFLPYAEGKEDLVCAKLLSLDDVEFCSVKKAGHRVVVEVQTSPFPQRTIDKNAMQAHNSGEIVAMTVLRGTPLKKIGDTVQAGETLVGNWFNTEDGGQVRVEIIARVRIACAWEGRVEAESAEEAFAKAYLCLDLGDLDELKSKEIEEKDGLYQVKIGYEAVETLNF